MTARTAASRGFWSSMKSASATTASSQGASACSTGMASPRESITTFSWGCSALAFLARSKPLPLSRKSVQISSS